MSFAQLFGLKTKSESNDRVIDFKLNQMDLVESSGVPLRTINRIISKWKQKGMLDKKNGKFVILDLPSFAKYVKSETRHSIASHG